jgi:glycosyltransferase involved in cell wall biosynthesis
VTDRLQLSVLSEYGFTRYALKEWIARSAIGRAAFEFGVCKASDIAAARGDCFTRAHYVCNALRLLESSSISAALERHRIAVLQDAGMHQASNRILEAYLRSAQALAGKHQYLQHGPSLAARMKFPKAQDDERRQGNLVVLKAYEPLTGEKGVLYLQYTESLRSFAALFDLEKVAARYRLVVEPSSWGYQDVAFLLFVRAGFDVIVQAQDEIDFEYIRSLDCNLIPTRLGAGDWIDPTTFSAEKTDKSYDFVMVASWSPVKRHSLLFAALARAGLHHCAVALIGYPWEGRTRDDIASLARRYGLTNVTIFERISRQEVAETIRRSRVGVMLSRREGANRGVYECFFCDVPVVMSMSNRGFNKAHINEQTGRMADDEELGDVLASVLTSSHKFAPREWAEANTGYKRASATLNEQVRTLAKRSGERFERNIAVTRSAPYAMYEDDADRLRLQSEYGELQRMLQLSTI